MSYSRKRTYPRVYMKKTADEKEDALTISGVTAACILALTFIEGALWGYILKGRTARNKSWL